METNRLPVLPQRWRNYWQDQMVTADENELAGLLKRYFDPSLIFCAGPYFLFVIEGSKNLIVRHIEGNFEQITGHSREPFIGQSFVEFHQMLPAQDRSVMVGFAQFCYNFLAATPPAKRRQLKFSFYFNILHQSGRLIPVIQQDTVHFNAANIPEYAFSFVTDISHLKAKNELMFSILSIDEQGNQHFKCSSSGQPNLQLSGKERLTLREREIISGLAEGLTSKQIAAELGIAFHTVNTHRQNMLAKTGCKSSAELVRYALKHALL